MDGVLLVFDARNLPNPHALATVPTKPQARRNRAVPAFATLILAIVLGMVYYVSTQRKPIIETPPASAASTSNLVPEVNPTPQAQPSEAIQVPTPEEPKPAPTKEPAAAPVKKASVKPANTAAPKAEPKVEPKKDDSKVGSILKKTGRILKKPFKF
jgi:cytoskeletal protein RodZ